MLHMKTLSYNNKNNNSNSNNNSINKNSNDNKTKICLRRIPFKVRAITCKNDLLKIYSQHANFLNAI